MAGAFIVRSGSGKRRVVVDLRPLNGWLHRDTVRFETLASFRDLFRPGDWGISLDLRSAFHHVAIHPDDQHYLRFAIGGRTFQCAALPFGLSTAPATFTRFVKPVVRLWRSRGWRVLPYLDDFLFLFGTESEALQARPRILADLQSLGLSSADDKGVWTPSQQFVHLAMTLNLKDATFQTEPRRLQRLQELAEVLHMAPARNQRWVDRRLLQVFCGLAISVLLAAPLVRPYLRQLYEAVARGTGPRTKLSRVALRDLDMLMDVLSASTTLDAPMTTYSAGTVLMDSDASLTGWGASLRQPDQARSSPGWTAHGGWPPGPEVPIYVLELRAVLLGLQSFRGQMRGVVELATDNAAAAFSLRGWASRSKAARKVLAEIWKELDQQRRRLAVRWIPTAENHEADRLPRCADRSDWQLAAPVVDFAVKGWGKPTIDRFASAANALCPRFNIWLAQPGAEAVDAFTQAWSSERNWINPPWPMATRALTTLLEQPLAEAIVVLPWWPDAALWPLLCHMADDVVRWAVGPSTHQAVTKRRVPGGVSRWDLVLAHVPQRA
jgi:ribonuclease HI